LGHSHTATQTQPCIPARGQRELARVAAAVARCPAGRLDAPLGRAIGICTLEVCHRLRASRPCFSPLLVRTAARALHSRARRVHCCLGCVCGVMRAQPHARRPQGVISHDRTALGCLATARARPLHALSSLFAIILLFSRLCFFFNSCQTTSRSAPAFWWGRGDCGQNGASSTKGAAQRCTFSFLLHVNC
jgi:hypothetical protein